MTLERLFGNDIKPACKYCTEAFQPLGDDRVLCMKKGIMPLDHACKKFSYDPIKRIPPRPKPMERFSEEDFSL